MNVSEMGEQLHIHNLCSASITNLPNRINLNASTRFGAHRNDQHGTGGALDDALPHTTEQDMVDRPVAVAAHGDEVRAQAFGLLQNLIGRGPLNHEALNIEALLPQAIPQGVLLFEVADGLRRDQLPRFAEIAEELAERLAGRVFVAHNARFDYGFLRREFERAGIKYHARTLCTVRLSRRLYPGAAGHDLDSLIARHGLECEARHRAMPDAAAVWQFLRIAVDEHGEDGVEVAARQTSRQPSLPPHLDRAAIDEIPEAPGAYIFYEGDTPLYVGKSRAMRSRAG